MAWTTTITDQEQSYYSFYDNALEIWNYAISQGCTEEAAAGLLGNIEAESYCNPGQFEIGKNYSHRWGMGLIQWTPTKKYWDQWGENPIVRALGDSWSDGALQIEYVFSGDLSSWIPTRSYPYSFSEWKALTDISEATRAYFAERERGTWSDSRIKFANHWYEEFTGVVPPPPTPGPTPGKGTIPTNIIWLLMKIAQNNQIV